MIFVNNSFQPGIVRISFIIHITLVNLSNKFSDMRNNSFANGMRFETNTHSNTQTSVIKNFTILFILIYIVSI